MSKKSEILVISHAYAYAYANTRQISDERRRPSAELVDAISAANGRAKTHTTSAQEVVDIALRAELQLTMSNLGRFGGVGVEVDHRGKGPAAASYRGVALVTAFTLRRKAAGWVLMSAHTEGVYSKTPERFVIAINPAHANRICAAALKPFTVVDAVEKKKAA